MGLVFRVMWHYHLRNWFLLDVCVYLGFYALWIATVGPGIHNGKAAKPVTIFVLNTWFALPAWNVIDFVCILLVYSYLFSTFTRGGAGSNGLVPLVVFATLFLTLNYWLI